MASINKRYYSLVVKEKEKEADIYIYGDIVLWEWFDSDVSSYTLAKEIEGLPEDIEKINVFINSYGGEVAEGLAIYNNLRRHKAKVKTYCDGFACSIASVVFMAGDERIMSNVSLLMIHNAWLLTAGDPNQLRKDADDLETINAASMQAYLNHTNITEEELKKMLDAETWISAADALEMGFATSVVNAAMGKAANQSLKKRMVEMILEQQEARAQTPKSDLKASVNIDADKVASKLCDLLEEKYKLEPEPEPDPAPDPEPEPEPENKLPNLLAALFR